MNKEPLSNHFTIISGFAFKSELFNDAEQGMPLIRIRDLAKGSTDAFYSGPYSQEYVVHRGDFLIGMDGEFRIYEWQGEDALLNQRVCKLKCISKHILPKYVFYLINRELKKIEDATPYSTVKHISARQILNIQLPTPTVDAQRRIVDILDCAERLRERREQASDDTTKILASLANHLFKEVKTVKTFADCCELEMGQSPPSSTYNTTGQGMPFYQGKTEFGEKYPTTKNYCSEPIKKAKKGDILMSVRAPVGDVNIAKEDCCIGRGLCAIRSKGIDREYLFQFLKANKNVIAAMGQGSTFQAINKSQIVKISIPIPEEKTQLKFREAAQLVEQISDHQMASTMDVEELFEALLAKTFSVGIF